MELNKDVEKGSYFDRDRLNDDDDIITLKVAGGDEIDFIEIAGIEYENSFYAILQPVELLDEMKDDEALVFRVTHVNGEDRFEIEMNDEIIDAVFDKYNELLDKYEKEQDKKQ